MVHGSWNGGPFPISSFPVCFSYSMSASTAQVPVLGKRFYSLCLVPFFFALLFFFLSFSSLFLALVRDNPAVAGVEERQENKRK